MKPTDEDLTTARRLVDDARAATLATLAQRPAGDPFATLVAVASDAEARPLLLLSRQAEGVRVQYLARHPDAKQWASFADFSFFRLEPEEIRFVAGFGRMGWIGSVEWRRGRP